MPHLVPPQGDGARKGLLAALAVGRDLLRAIVVSAVLLDVFDLLLSCVAGGLFEVVLIDLDISAFVD